MEAESVNAALMQAVRAFGQQSQSADGRSGGAAGGNSPTSRAGRGERDSLSPETVLGLDPARQAATITYSAQIHRTPRLRVQFGPVGFNIAISGFGIRHTSDILELGVAGGRQEHKA